jgi:hypothetical protein
MYVYFYTISNISSSWKKKIAKNNSRKEKSFGKITPPCSALPKINRKIGKRAHPGGWPFHVSTVSWSLLNSRNSWIRANLRLHCEHKPFIRLARLSEVFWFPEVGPAFVSRFVMRGTDQFEEVTNEVQEMMGSGVGIMRRLLSSMFIYNIAR